MEIAKLFVCPQCKRKTKEETKMFVCMHCKLKFSLTEEGIPNFLIDEAERF